MTNSTIKPVPAPQPPRPLTLQEQSDADGQTCGQCGEPYGQHIANRYGCSLCGIEGQGT